MWYENKKNNNEKSLKYSPNYSGVTHCFLFDAVVYNNRSINKYVII